MANWNIEGNYYVDGISGSDGNDGSANSPFKTINAAVNAASADETIVVGTGTYNEQLHLGTTTGNNTKYKFIADGIVILILLASKLLLSIVRGKFPFVVNIFAFIC